MPSEKARRAYRPVVENLLHRPATEEEVDGFIRRVRLKLLIFGAVILTLLALGVYFVVKPALNSVVVPKDGGGLRRVAHPFRPRMTVHLIGDDPVYNGNTLFDNVHSYTWDAEGKAITADSLALTYDALGRMVEQGGTTQNPRLSGKANPS